MINFFKSKFLARKKKKDIDKSKLMSDSKDWVSKAIKSKIQKPIIIAIVSVVSIVGYNLSELYSDISSLEEKKENLLQKVKKQKQRLKAIKKMSNKQKEAIVIARGVQPGSKEPVMLIKKVCELLKLRDVIGSFYISKRKSKKFKNVLVVNIKISYGDKELSKAVLSIMLNQIFYLKNIKITQKGISCELFRPQ
jgi:hypothetical protein